MKLDVDEKELLDSVERGEWKSARGGKRERTHYAQAVALTLVAVAAGCLAALLPALRVASVDPVATLRAEWSRSEFEPAQAPTRSGAYDRVKVSR